MVTRIPPSARKCDDCNGSGLWHGHGHTENGVFVGATGTCFRCRGKGHQTPDDTRRNTYYDNHVRKFDLAH